MNVHYTEKTEAVWFYIDFTLENNIQQFLCEILAPRINDLKKKKHINASFFVREWEKKHLIKVRVKLSNPTSVPDDLVDEIAGSSGFEDYVSANSCSVNVGELNKREYQEQFGGEAGFRVMEELFDESSTTTCMIFLNAYQKWDYSLAISFAIQKQLVFLKNSFTDLDEIITFLKSQLDYCLNLSFKNPNFNLHNDEKPRMLAYYEQSYIKQKQLIHNLINWFYFDFATNREEWVEKWGKAVRNKVGVFFQLYSNNLIEITPVHSYKLSTSIPHAKLPEWSILGSLMHLENNRMGINYRDEPFIYYLILQGIINYGK